MGRNRLEDQDERGQFTLVIKYLAVIDADCRNIPGSICSELRPFSSSRSANEATRPEGTQAGSVPVPGEIGGTSSELVRALCRRLPDERRAITHHFSIAGHEGYLTVGVYDNGLPGEIFVRMAKEGSTISGLMDSIATLVSLALQHGVPLEVLRAKFSHTRFEPSGWSGNPKIGYATSLMDYLFRWMELKFLTKEQGELFESRPMSSHTAPPPKGKGPVEALAEFVQFGDAPACNICGSLMVRSGTCYRCMTCRSTSGCS